MKTPVAALVAALAALPLIVSADTSAPQSAEVEVLKGRIEKLERELAMLRTMSFGVKTNPAPTKGVSAHPDYYGCADKQSDPKNPMIIFPDWQRYYDMPNVEGVAEHIPPARLTGADNVTPVGWERGKTAYRNGHAVDADHPAVGCSMTVCTHMRELIISGCAQRQLMFSRMDFDENGLLVRVVPCSNWYTIMQAYRGFPQTTNRPSPNVSTSTSTNSAGRAATPLLGGGLMRRIMRRPASGGKSSAPESR